MQVYTFWGIFAYLYWPSSNQKAGTFSALSKAKTNKEMDFIQIVIGRALQI